MKPTLDWLANPEIFAVNREPAHSDHFCIVKGQQLRQLLNGTWKPDLVREVKSCPGTYIQ